MLPLRWADCGSTETVGIFFQTPAVRPAIAPVQRFTYVKEGCWKMFVEVRSGRVRALKPFAVEFERQAGMATVYHEGVEVYGAGMTLDEAQRDFQAATLELFDFLSSLRTDELGPLPEQQLRELRAHLAMV